MGGAKRMGVDPRKAAQEEAEKTFELFIDWTKKVVYISIFCLVVVVVGCNSGVETGPNKTGSQYNGEQYDPQNLNIRKNK